MKTVRRELRQVDRAIKRRRAKVEKRKRHNYGGKGRKDCRNSDKKRLERDKNSRVNTKKADDREKRAGVGGG